MGFGPVDIVIIDFPGNNFNGKVAPAILELVESGTIRLIQERKPHGFRCA
jgi:hypothetical protein